MSLPYDPSEATAALSAADPELARLIGRVGPLRLEVREVHSPFDALLRAIVYQQLSGKAAATIYGRLLERFGGVPPTPPQLLDAPVAELRGAGLSRAKTAAAHDLAQKTLDGVVPPLDVLQTMPDQDIIERLTTVRGVGVWTAQMLLIFRLGRPDVLPAGDLGVRRGFMRTYGLDELPPPRVLRAHGERWRPWRSAAAWYLWRAADERS